jgi:DNA-binding HxlR family transcriptional regulator
MVRIRKSPAAQRRPASSSCSTADALERVGDWWTLLIVRDLFHGPRSFTALAEHLGVARNILTDRLERMAADGLIEKTRPREQGARWDYRLTEKGRDLLPVMIALMQWGDKWVCGPGKEPLTLIDARDGKPVQKIGLRAWDGRPLSLQDIRALPGPGAAASA